MPLWGGWPASRPPIVRRVLCGFPLRFRMVFIMPFICYTSMNLLSRGNRTFFEGEAVVPSGKPTAAGNGKPAAQKPSVEISRCEIRAIAESIAAETWQEKKGGALALLLPNREGKAFF